jgi:hypothetical protein
VEYWLVLIFPNLGLIFHEGSLFTWKQFLNLTNEYVELICLALFFFFIILYFFIFTEKDDFVLTAILTDRDVKDRSPDSLNPFFRAVVRCFVRVQLYQAHPTLTQAATLSLRSVVCLSIVTKVLRVLASSR